MNLVQYRNDLNRVTLNFNEKCLDIFFTICQRVKNKGDADVMLTFSEIIELSNYKTRSIARLTGDLDLLYNQLLNLRYKIEDDKQIIRFSLFNKYKIDKKQKNITISLNEEFKYILNDFMSGDYTRFDLSEFTGIKSIYAKNMFRILKQYQYSKANPKFFEISIDEFKRILNVPIKYKMCEIDINILKKIKKELASSFFNLTFKKFKEGRKVTKLRFEWEERKKEEKVIPHYVGVQIENCLKNSNISKVYDLDMFESLVAELLGEHDEIELEIALEQLSERVKREFKHKNYIKSAIINRISENKVDKNVMEEIINRTKRVMYLTQEEFDKKWKEYCDKNNLSGNDSIARKVFEIKYKLIG